MRLRSYGVLATAAIAVLLGSIQCLAQHAYITNTGSNTVWVIDTERNRVVAKIDGFRQPFGVAVTPDGSKVYVTNSPSGGNSTVSVIATATNKVIAPPITVGSEPGGVAVAPDGRKAYVANTNSDSVSVIDTASDSVTATISTGTGTGPFGVAVAPDGRKAYVTLSLRNSSGPKGYVAVIDTASNKVITTIPVGSFPTGVAVTPDGRRVYAANQSSANLSVIDTATNAVIATMGVGSVPTGVAVAPDGRTVYVANAHSNSVSVINVKANAVSRTIPVGSGRSEPGPVGLSVTPNGRKLYVATRALGPSGSVTVIDTRRNRVTDTVSVGTSPQAFGVFIRPAAARFAGTPGEANCRSRSVSELRQRFRDLNAAAAALGFSDVKELEEAITAFCED